MKRRAVAAVVGSSGEPIPECLLVGACVEVWDPLEHDSMSALRNHRAAVRMWCERNGITWPRYEGKPEALARGGPPWSYEYLAARDRKLLAQVRCSRNLPADWRPTAAPAAWLLNEPGR